MGRLSPLPSVDHRRVDEWDQKALSLGAELGSMHYGMGNRTYRIWISFDSRRPGPHCVVLLAGGWANSVLQVSVS